ncbi:uncharacterized protein BDV17DRAFT_255985 [Aspergillus undulatus]|uniref:uncharacterized protein n=1 Tax=Aspergillus undulatus TaxID=1810928 RepID=UPI003CCE2B8B
MQRMWTRGVPGAPVSQCISCLSATAEGIVSGTASTASKQSLRIRTSVTALYTSIFAAAALADARAKTRRRGEWEKIAAVKHQFNELTDEEQRLLSTLSLRGPRRSLRRPPQTRSYHTLPRPTHRNVQLPTTRPPCRLSHSSSNDSNVPVDSGVDDADLMKELEAEALAPLEQDEDEFNMSMDVEDVPHWLRTDLLRSKAIKRLALKQLAIRFLLRPALAHDYYGIQKNYASDGAVPQLDVANLLFELSAVRRRIRQIKANPNANIDDLVRDIRVRRLEDTVYGNKSLNELVHQDTILYLRDEMPLEELLLRLSSYLLQVQDPDQPFAFTRMLVAFTKTRQNDLADLVIKSFIPYKFQLNHALIMTTLNYYRKSKDLKGFDLFLQMLEGKGYPVDMGFLGYYKNKVINGISISVPPMEGTNIIIYATLIKACLRFDQPARADAYLLAARGAGLADEFAILMAYMEFYTIRRDSEKALQVIQRALAYLASSTEHPLRLVERLIVKMVKLSDSCHIPELSEVLIGAAVDSGFSPDIPRRQKDMTFDVDPEFERWAAAARTSTFEPQVVEGDPYHAFARSAKQHLDVLTTPEEESSDRRLAKRQGTYSRQLLSSALDWRPTPSIAEAEGQPQAVETESKPTSSSPEDTITAERQEISALRTEVAQLKEMIQHLYQPTAAPTTLPTSMKPQHRFRMSSGA